MKKFVVISLAVVMLFSMCMTVFAGPGGFVKSPSLNQAPVLVEATNEVDDCVAQIIVTAYADRAKLPEDDRLKLEEVYKMVVENPDLSKLIAKLQEIADELGVEVTDLAVSDLFDISSTYCESHDEHGHFDITLKADTLKNFVCLVHYYNDEFRIVDDAKVTNNGEHLEFTEKEFSPFLIVTNTAAQGDAPQTNDISMIYVWIMVAAAAGLVLVLGLSTKKQRA